MRKWEDLELDSIQFNSLYGLIREICLGHQETALYIHTSSLGFEFGI